MLAGRSKLGSAAALLSLGASFGAAVFGGLAFTLLRIAPQQGSAEIAAVSLGGLPPEQIAHAFRIVFMVLAVFAAIGAGFAARVPVLNIETGSSGDSPGAE